MKRRHKFSLSHFKLLTGKMGYLYPISCIETLPGDTFQMATSVFLRFSPMVAPVMTPVTVKIHHWFVPLRLLWDEFEDFITGGPDGTSVPVHPHVFITQNSAYQGLEDYFGLPKLIDGESTPTAVSSLPFRAYNLIWNEWYRDEDLQEPLPFTTASGFDNSQSTPRMLQRSCWDKDYFTSARPWEQKGVAMSVPVNGTPSGTLNIFPYGTPTFTNGSHIGPLVGSTSPAEGGDGGASASATLRWSPDGYSTSSGNLKFSEVGLRANFEGSASLGEINLNQFREAMALQRFEEHRALYGSRYTEYLRYLGVRASDGRLQRPEYLGGGRSIIQFSEVLQTAADGDTPVGTMRGHGIGAIRTNRFRRFFEEHGLVISLLSIRPKSIYTQALPPVFRRFIKTDYWQKELEHIGQQEIKNRDIFYPSIVPKETFGYSDRYDEYRSHFSSVHGEFRDLLNYWHLGRDLSNTPALNSDFVSSLPTDRVFADQTGSDTIYMMVNNSVQARRLVSKRGNPI